MEEKERLMLSQIQHQVTTSKSHGKKELRPVMINNIYQLACSLALTDPPGTVFISY